MQLSGATVIPEAVVLTQAAFQSPQAAPGFPVSESCCFCGVLRRQQAQEQVSKAAKDNVIKKINK